MSKKTFFSICVGLYFFKIAQYLFIGLRKGWHLADCDWFALLTAPLDMIPAMVIMFFICSIPHPLTGRSIFSIYKERQKELKDLANRNKEPSKTNKVEAKELTKEPKQINKNDQAKVPSKKNPTDDPSSL